MRKKLTAVGIPTLPQGDYADINHPGLRLRVGAKRRTWSVWHRLGGRPVQTTIGHWPDMGLADARHTAGALAERIDAGLPIAPAKPHARDHVLTLGELVDRYEQHRQARGGRGTKSLDVAIANIRRGADKWLNKPAAAFDKAAFRECRDRLMEHGYPVAANRFVSSVQTCLKWGEQEDLIEVAPRIIMVGAETARERTLTYSEIAAIWKAAGTLGTYGRLVRLALVTGLRRGEAAGLKHGDILDGTLRLPASRTKANRALVLPLPPLALDIVGHGEARDYVFRSGWGGRIQNFGPPKTTLDELSGVSRWVFHDLRRTCATGLQEIGVTPDVVQAVLNHAVGGGGVAGTYMRSQMEAAKRDALQRWASELERIVAGRRAAS